MEDVPYQNALGRIIYSMGGTRPNLAYLVGLVSRFMSKPMKENWQAVKWILRYIQGSVEIRLCYKKKGSLCTDLSHV